MRKAEVCFWLDCALFLTGVGLALSGFVRWFISPGSGWGYGGGRWSHPEFIFPCVTWLNIHKFLSIVFICLVVLHIALHWDWVAAMFRSVLRK